MFLNCEVLRLSLGRRIASKSFQNRKEATSRRVRQARRAQKRARETQERAKSSREAAQEHRETFRRRLTAA